MAGGSRIALSKGLDAERFTEEVQRYGVTVVSYTWTMMREILDAESLDLLGNYPIRLFLGSGMPQGLWRRTTECFAPAKVLEFYASTEGDVVLANVAGAKIGCKGRPLPGSADVRLAAYDPISGRLLEDDRGFVRECADNEVGLLLGRAGVHGEMSVWPCGASSPPATRGSRRKISSAAMQTVTSGWSITRRPSSPPPEDLCSRNRSWTPWRPSTG